MKEVFFIRNTLIENILAKFSHDLENPTIFPSSGTVRYGQVESQTSLPVSPQHLSGPGLQALSISETPTRVRESKQMGPDVMTAKPSDPKRGFAA